MANQPCNKCGSSDAVQAYEDGDFCFSCGTKVFKKRKNAEKHYPSMSADTFTRAAGIPIKALAWLYRYHFTPELIEKYNIFWAESINLWSTNKQKYYTAYNKLVMPIYDKDYKEEKGRVCRSFCDEERKYLTQLTPDLLFYSQTILHEPQVCVITEDVLSAIRVGENIPAVSILGSNVSPKSKKLLNLLGSAKAFLIWLDGDKPGRDGAKKLHTILTQFAPVGIIKTKEDPKFYSDNQIKLIVNNELSKVSHGIHI